MKLNEENYFSEEADFEFMSVSQYKEFAGTPGKLGCEERAMASLRGEYQREKTTALMVGSYVDAYFEGGESFGNFQIRNPEIFTKNGGLKAEYRKADDIIDRIERDEFFMECMSGEKQVIMTGDIFGIPWKIKMDSYIPDKVIVDLKIVESIRKQKWVKEYGNMDFIRYWGYDIQGAIYQEVVYQNTGKRLPFYIAAASKEPTTDIQVIHVWDQFLRQAMDSVQFHIERVKAVKGGEEKPERCGVCDYCLETKVIHEPISLLDLDQRQLI